MADAPQSEIMSALVELERDELATYCESVAVEGVIAQTLQLTLRRGQSLWCSKGCLIGYHGIGWKTRIPGGASKAVRRVVSGEGVGLNFVTAERDGARVTLGANQPGRLVTWDLSRGAIICTPGSFVAALGEVDIDVTVARSAGAAFFGGAGLFLQKLSGSGIAVVHGAGDFIEQQLAPGETLQVSTGNLAFFSAEVGYGVRGVGGCRQALFGGEGLFMTELTGPGWVMMQSLKKLPGGRGSSGGRSGG